MPDTLAKAIKKCNEIQYPDLFELLNIGCTFPVTYSEFERSFSVSLAIISIYYNENIDCKEVSKLFFSLHPRKLREKNLVFD